MGVPQHTIQSLNTMEYQFKSQPMGHQLKTFELSKDAEAWGILFEMGVGKSKVAVDTAAYLYSLGRINCFVVLAPNGVHRKWLLEDIPLSLPDHIEYKAAIWEAGNTKSMTACEDLLLPGAHLRILLANIEGMSYAKLPEFLKRLLRSTDSLLVVDESSRIKNPTSKRTKKLMELVKETKYRRILAGDAVVNSPFDLFSQVGFLYEGALGYSFPAFKAEYAEMLPATDSMVIEIMRKNNLRYPPQIARTNEDGTVRYKNLEKLKRIIEPFCTRYTKAECLELPEKIYVTHYFKLAKEQRAIYDRMAKEFKYELNGNTVGVAHKLTLALRLQQVACGFLPGEHGEPSIHLFKTPEENPRIAQLIDSLEDVQGQVIIWCRYQDDIRLLEKVFGDQAALYYGGEPDKKCQLAMQEFKAGKKRYFIGTAAKGGIGLNLTCATTVVYYSNTFNAGDRWQSEDRAHRIGQKDNVLYIDLQAEDTIDDKIIRALHNKKDLSQYMLELTGAGKPLV